LVFGFEPEFPLSGWVFALVAPFKTVVDSVSSNDLASFWKNGGEFPANELIMTSESKTALESVLGLAGASVKIMAREEIANFLNENVDVWAIVPFTEVSSTNKVIAIDGMSPLQKSFDPSSYPLIVPIGLSKIDGASIAQADLEEIIREFQAVLPKSNRDPEKLTTVVLTGVTALARATAKEMELNGVLSPAVSIGELMREADIAHVSNEVPFARDCPPPQWVQEKDLVFCSDVKYIDLMREIGTDVVELTGDHFADWGPEAMYLTLEMYRNEGWDYYGGGWDIDEAREPLKIEHNGNKIAFLGCNAKAPGYATASATVPGALHCDMDDLASRVSELRAEGYMVIVTFQHQEIYRWDPTEQMISDSRRIADAGATIVSGSQAHQPHIYEFYGDTFIHYGLGNLFFDQLGWFDDSNKAFLDRHVFYDGKYLGVELITVQFFNWSTPTLMTPEAREEMLTRLFEYSQMSE
jgi:poly-gamma-glutamate synthesis protein (capsule biosynthesis protein)